MRRKVHVFNRRDARAAKKIIISDLFIAIEKPLLQWRFNFQFSFARQRSGIIIV
jgi:hypothetical protein